MNIKKDIKIILASGSPRRKELLKLIVPKFEVQVSNIDEKLQKGLSCEEQVSNLAYLKAKNIYDRTKGDRIIIGSDTIVVKNNKIYGKPNNKKHAKEILKELIQGDRTHRIITGLSILVQKDEKYQEYNTFDEVKVYLKNMSDEEIDNWINTGHAMDKAGAYAIQDEFCIA